MRPTFPLLLILLSLPLFSQAQSARPAAPERMMKPHFRGNLDRYLAKSVRYPKAAAEKGIQGRCIVEFMIDERGTVLQVASAESSGDPLLDAEACRAVAAMPAWRPGSWNQQPARYLYSVPVRFQLD